jgi:hypothetical protein
MADTQQVSLRIDLAILSALDKYTQDNMRRSRSNSVNHLLALTLAEMNYPIGKRMAAEGVK